MRETVSKQSAALQVCYAVSSAATLFPLSDAGVVGKPKATTVDLGNQFAGPLMMESSLDRA